MNVKKLAIVGGLMAGLALPAGVAVAATTTTAPPPAASTTQPEPKR